MSADNIEPTIKCEYCKGLGVKLAYGPKFDIEVPGFGLANYCEKCNRYGKHYGYQKVELEKQ